MRTKSKKTAALDRSVKRERQGFGRQQILCAAGCGNNGCDVHEIARGPARAKAKLDRHAWLWLCRSCHESMGSLAVWPIARQMACKLLSDPEYFDLERICELRGRAVTDVQMYEVVEYLELQ